MLSQQSHILIGGSRHLVAASAAGRAVSAIARHLSGAHVLHVGGATGADAIAIQSAAPSSLIVFAAFGRGGAGAWRHSAVSAVSSAAAAGAQVHYLAGGALSLPLRARLIRRSLAALSGVSLAVFVSPGHGSLSVAAHAIAQGIPVYIWSLVAPSIPGAVQAGRVSLASITLWSYRPAQISLF